MIAYFTHSASHLIPHLQLPQGSLTIAQFSDGELLVTASAIDSGKELWVIASTASPAENLVELFLLLNALKQAGAPKINLLFLYFGYARQANGAQLIATLLGQFPLARVEIIHTHNPDQLAQWLPYTNRIPIDFFTTIAQQYDAIVAPDAGAALLARTIATKLGKETIFLQKMRDHEQITISPIMGNLTEKKLVIVDDIIATGSTISQAAQLLAAHGAREIAAAATHGLFCGNAQQLLAASPISTIYVTNTIPRYTSLHSALGMSGQTLKNIEIYDTSHFLRGFFLPSIP